MKAAETRKGGSDGKRRGKIHEGVKGSSTRRSQGSLTCCCIASSRAITFFPLLNSTTRRFFLKLFLLLTFLPLTQTFYSFFLPSLLSLIMQLSPAHHPPPFFFFPLSLLGPGCSAACDLIRSLSLGTSAGLQADSETPLRVGRERRREGFRLR